MASESLNDTGRLLRAAQGGDRVAFGSLVDRYRDRLEAFIRSRMGPSLLGKTDVEDVVQETVLKAFRSLRSFEWHGEESFLRWIIRIAANVIFQTARRERPGLIVPLLHDVSAGGPTQSTTMRRAERFDRLREAVKSLSPDYRQVVLLARIERLPIREVARRIGRSTKATNQLLWRAMQKLKASFGHTDSLGLPQENLESGSGHDGDQGLV